jgi:small-conductance mechanosensitive channel
VASLAFVLRSEAALPLAGAWGWLALGLLGAGLIWSLPVGLLDRDGSRPRGGWLRPWLPTLTAAVAIVPASLGASLVGDGPPAPEFWLAEVTAALAASALLALLGLQALGAVENGSARPLAELSTTVGHALVGGAALVMMVGLLCGRMTAMLAYHLGAAVLIGDLLVLASTAVWLAGVRSALAGARGRFEPPAGLQQGLSIAMISALVGLLLPGLLILADLATARLSATLFACALLAVSHHSLRYAGVLLRVNPPPQRAPVRRSSDVLASE